MNRILVLVSSAGLALATGCGRPSETSPGSGAAGGKKITIALLPKSKGNAYFLSCKKGADRAARELGADVIFDGPTDPDPARQNEIVENWITLGVDAIAAACENKEGISTALRKARARGIKVITYDSDALPAAREFFVNQATPQGIGYALMDEAARLSGNEGEFAVISGTLTAGNQIEWRKFVEERLAAKYPKMTMVAVRPCDDLKDKAQRVSESQAGPQHHVPRRARRRGSDQAGGQDRRREEHRAGFAQREQALRARRRDAERDPLENGGPRLSHRAGRLCALQGRAETG
jgi:ABC-type sugar transport system substrate-binding protein